MFLSSLILAVIASLAAAVLAVRLRKMAPDMPASADAPSGREFWPFWTLAFLSPERWRRLPPGLKPLALVSTAALGAALVLMATVLFRFVVGGGSL